MKNKYNLSARKQKQLIREFKLLNTKEEKLKMLSIGIPHVKSRIDLETLKISYMPFVNGVTFPSKKGKVINCKTEEQAYKKAVAKIKEWGVQLAKNP